MLPNVVNNIFNEATDISQNNWRSRAEQTTSFGDPKPIQPELPGVRWKAADYDYEDEDDDSDLTQTLAGYYCN